MRNEPQKYTVITGASSGIGRAAACAFAERGRNLVITARRSVRLRQLREDILARHPDVDVVVRCADLADPRAARELYGSLRDFEIGTWINNAGFGSYALLAGENIRKIEKMLRLNVEAVTTLSMLFVREHRDAPGAQLINVASCGGYTIVPTAVAYCASKFFVSAFTEGLARELVQTGARLRAKVLAPAATSTEFGMVANNADDYDYDQAFRSYHTSEQVASFLLQLYDSDKTVGLVDRESFVFQLLDPLHPYAGNSAHNQTAGGASAVDP